MYEEIAIFSFLQRIVDVADCVYEREREREREREGVTSFIMGFLLLENLWALLSRAPCGTMEIVICPGTELLNFKPLVNLRLSNKIA